MAVEIQWVGYRITSWEPINVLFPNAQEVLRKYLWFIGLFGNPYGNKKLQTKLKGLMKCSILGKKEPLISTRPIQIDRKIGPNFKAFKDYFNFLESEGFYDINSGVVRYL